MEKLNMQTTNMVDENIKRIGELKLPLLISVQQKTA